MEKCRDCIDSAAIENDLAMRTDKNREYPSDETGWTNPQSDHSAASGRPVKGDLPHINGL